MRIGILTGGGDVPGLNACIKAVTMRVTEAGHDMVGIRRGWGGLLHTNPDDPATAEEYFVPLDKKAVRTIDRSGGTVLHSSRTHPGKVRGQDLPGFLEPSGEEPYDFTPHAVAVLESQGIDVLIPIGGDDTLSYGVHLHTKGVPVIAIPKTMDNDVPGTDYCIGFSTCVTRTIAMTHALRTTAGSHERYLVLEVFGRYAGFTALLPTMAGAANRCVIPEHPFDVELLCELLTEDRYKNPSSYSVVLVSEGATFKGMEEMAFESGEKDMFGHKKLGGVGDRVARALREVSPKFNNGRRVNVINQRLGYLGRSGDPDALDSVVPMAFGNLAMDLIHENVSGRLVCVRNGIYDSVPISAVTGSKKVVDVVKHYNVERLRPRYKRFGGLPLFIMTGAL